MKKTATFLITAIVLWFPVAFGLGVIADAVRLPDTEVWLWVLRAFSALVVICIDWLIVAAERTDETKGEPELRRIHWSLAVPLTGWCLLWLVFNGYNYMHLTWHLFSTLKWLSFALLINPCFAIWIAFFSSAAWAPLNFSLIPWAKFGREFGRWKIVLLVVFVPMLLGLVLQFIGPYFYPVTYGGEDGTHVFLRFIPILGGRGYN